MKIAHIADLHCCKENAEEAIASLRFLAQYIKKSPVSMVAIAGDTWDASMLNTEGSGFNRFIDAIREIADIAPVAMIYGTPAHDTDGSLEVFRKLTCKYGITVLDPGQPYFLSYINDKGKIVPDIPGMTGKLVLFGIPEPRKKYLLANNSAGKDESEEAIRSAMHKLCFLLAAKRKDYADIPCVVLYHGEVAGTVYQNNLMIERGTGLSLTIDELADIGADYYALGHIHKPQKVGNINAYYSGSIYPKNFGETHQSSFKIVDIEPSIDNERLISVDTVDFPHPQNMKIERKYPNLADLEDIKGKRVWLEVTCTKEERALFDSDNLLKSLLDKGAVSGSRVTISETAIETVRAAEITAVNTPEKKFEVWAENSNVEFTARHLKKIAELNTEISKKETKPEGLWELLSLRLKGSIGIMRGIKKEEITLNFEKYGNGLIALSGDNGKGKTTCIENCHPYPQLFTRKGKLQDHFFMKDSIREVIYKNHIDNSVWKFLIQIDGQNKSGSCKYFISKKTDNASEWTPLSGVDGNLKPYEEALGVIFGSVDLFRRTAFITQKSTKDLPDLTDATAGEKKTLFIALAGIDYLQGFSDTATEKAKLENAKKHDAEIKAQMLKDVIGKKSVEEKLLEETEILFKKKTSDLAEITKQGKIVKADVDRLQLAWNAEQVRQQKESGLKTELETIEADICSLADNIDKQKEYAGNKSAYEKKVSEYEARQKLIEYETTKEQIITKANLKRQEEYTAVKNSYIKEVQAIINERQDLDSQKNKIETSIITMHKNIELYERDAAEIKEYCPTCGQKLSDKTKIEELAARRKVYVRKIEKEKEEIQKQNNAITELNQKIEDLEREQSELEFSEPEPPKNEIFDGKKLEAAIKEQKDVNITAIRADLAQAQQATVRIEEIHKQIDDKQNLHKTKAAEYKKVRQAPEIGEKIKTDLDVATEKHTELTEKYTVVKSEIARAETVIESVKKTLADIAEKEKELIKLHDEGKTAVIEGQEWELIAKAFGKDGIQALELDALAPGISETANRILESGYGDRYNIEIRTTRIGGVGKKTKQIEDFLIYVTDSEAGETDLLDDKSGGEAVWIKRAIYDAFAVIRKRNTNFAFLTCFQDETDGQLDSAAKTAYCRMLEAAHAESKLRHTIIITHSNEVKAMIEQRIDMEELTSKGGYKC